MPDTRRRVLVTRPEPGASKTARLLEEMGFAPVTLPLQEIHELPVDPQAIPDGASAVAITSVNAIRHASNTMIGRLTSLPCFAIGATTAAAARAAGFSDVIEGSGDADALAQAIVARRIAGPAIYLCGRVRRPQFERRLGEAHVAVIPVETYDARGIVRSAEELSDAFGARPINHVLIYSAGAAEAFAGIMTRAGLSDMFEGTEFLCISARAADALGLGRGKIRVAPEPSEAALLALLGQIGGRAS